MLQTLKSILARIARNPLRGALSILSIAIGVTLVALILNLSFRLDEQVRAVDQKGAMRIAVTNAERIENGMQWERPPVFTTGDAAALRRDYPRIEEITPLFDVGDPPIQVGEDIYRPSQGILGVDAAYPEIVDLQLKAGSFFTDRDVAAQSRVTVISEEAARLLFGGAEQAVGGTILSIDERDSSPKTPYRVIGVYASPPPLVQQAFGVADFLIPYSSSTRGYPNGAIGTFYCLVAGDDFESARANLERSMRELHGDDVKLVVWQGDPRSPLALDKAGDLRRTQTTITLFFGAFALVALLISSFGIFSVMTINTLERTREIGLCRTIGATKTRIVGNLLFEALLLAVMGALIGIALAAVFNSPVIKAIQPVLGGQAAGGTALASTGLGLPAVLCALAVTALAGVLFGLFPALSAARIEPVESLREG